MSGDPPCKLCDDEAIGQIDYINVIVESKLDAVPSVSNNSDLVGTTLTYADYWKPGFVVVEEYLFCGQGGGIVRCEENAVTAFCSIPLALYIDAPSSSTERRGVFQNFWRGALGVYIA